jgi:transcriptional regulator with XRE-family HTH domain
MEKRSESLGDYVRRMIFTKELSGAEVSRRSKRGGRKGISREYVSQIQNGLSFNPSKDKLAALAVGLGVSVDEVLYAALKTPPPTQNRFKLLSARYEELPEDKKSIVEPLIQMVEREVFRLYLESESLV